MDPKPTIGMMVAYNPHPSHKDRAVVPAIVNTVCSGSLVHLTAFTPHGVFHFMNVPHGTGANQWDRLPSPVHGQPSITPGGVAAATPEE